MAGARAVPRALSGSGPDRFLWALDKVAVGMEWLQRNSRRNRRPVAPVDRDIPLEVAEVRAEADEVISLRLVGDGLLPTWQPGAHLDLVLPSGRTRQYSLCGEPGDRRSYRIAVRRIADGAGGSREVHDVLRPGSRITARGPRNAFPFITAEKYLFIAGGIGITPILPMVRTAAARGADWRLVHTGRSRESMPFLDELAELDPVRVWIRPDTEFGIPASGAELLEHTPPGAAVYCCGPIPMITGVRVDLPASAADSLHWERFSAPPINDGRPFTVELARTGRTVQVPADRSALEAITEVLPQVSFSCRQGFCGTCHVRVLDGEVEHRGRAAGDHMAICVSRSDGHVVLDL
ncbi:Ferredoxin-NADP reductase [Saccharopolyspora antimicrobica]|uniref:Ferredoxin-NADP reductase n=1 Tax=Saccharopolyspora antimicrobica TaxID=455193 RepID=A0A1I4R477_9PSEU|nr:PDR/VanB family oxidoreductase [Saccharopolyspora antimicrobica]RKT88174.1 ferredoxin-NADP reductase [Saccharopolyspora antimicrobica]SFM47092.1 Ferredoxin-NADP reductase [Saccharopolyspora antimicrobica]